MPDRSNSYNAHLSSERFFPTITPTSYHKAYQFYEQNHNIAEKPKEGLWLFGGMVMRGFVVRIHPTDGRVK